MGRCCRLGGVLPWSDSEARVWWLIASGVGLGTGGGHVLVSGRFGVEKL